MPNPFEDEDGTFMVLANEENQHSLWPTFVDVPSGWKAVFGPETRRLCIEYVELNWSDMRPLSLAIAMDR
jgi:uncharacterized protein YbdZ (MbtH family)